MTGWTMLAALLIASCVDEGQFCYAGDYRRCECEDGASGFEQCNSVGEAYGECDCESGIPGAASGTGGAAGGSGGSGGASGGAGGSGGAELLPFLSPCDEDEECESGLCFAFNAKGPHCTTPCDGPEDCPPPSTGCNMMGVCKVP